MWVRFPPGTCLADRSDDRSIEDDGSPIFKQRKRFLNGKKQAFDVDVEDVIEVFLRNGAQRSETA
jgi:hypothetical protein